MSYFNEGISDEYCDDCGKYGNHSVCKKTVEKTVAVNCECEDMTIYENHDCTLSAEDSCFSCEKLYAKTI